MTCEHHAELRAQLKLPPETTDNEIEMRLLAAMEYMVKILRVKYGMETLLRPRPN